ncbi:MAG TPA: DnaA/Hda family protein [Kiritimatiellia bacterium]|nr:DnaA/Hda family protein [Kiritimatiellia bacterium]
MLNPAYTFETFLPVRASIVARRRAMAFAAGTGHPLLVLQGGVGLGKTHLLHAIARAVPRPARIRLLQGDRLWPWLLEDVFSLRFPDVLLADDLNLLTGRESLQRRFVRLLAVARSGGARIAFACASLERELPEIWRGLTGAGLCPRIVDLRKPGASQIERILRHRFRVERSDPACAHARRAAAQARGDIRRAFGLLLHHRCYRFGAQSAPGTRGRQ